MTNQKLNDSKTALKNSGTLPVLQEEVKGEIVFNRPEAKQIDIFPINVSGERKKALKIKKENGLHKFDLSTGKSFVYEVRIK